MVFAEMSAADRARAVSDCRSRMLTTWAGSWDAQRGRFPERLDAASIPSAADAPTRALTQFRLLWSLCSGAMGAVEGEERALTAAIYEATVARYWDPHNGGWFTSVSAEGRAANDGKDLYTHAFAILSMSRYYAVSGEESAAEMAVRTLELIEAKLSCPAGGFYGSASRDWQVTARELTQNPHMHLFEACLEGAAIDARFSERCDALLQLATERFFTVDGGVIEFFDESWRPHVRDGHLREPGHHFEWAWLLEEYARVFGVDRRLPALQVALAAAGAKGWDAVAGGLFDCVDPLGQPVRDTKRLWPQSECVRALAAIPMLAANHADLSRLSNSLLFDRYLRPDGGWVEWMTRDLTPHVDDMPGTSVYHLLGALNALSESLGRN